MHHTPSPHSPPPHYSPPVFCAFSSCLTFPTLTHLLFPLSLSSFFSHTSPLLLLSSLSIFALLRPFHPPPPPFFPHPCPSFSLPPSCSRLLFLTLYIPLLSSIYPALLVLFYSLSSFLSPLSPFPHFSTNILIPLSLLRSPSPRFLTFAPFPPRRPLPSFYFFPPMRKSGTCSVFRPLLNPFLLPTPPPPFSYSLSLSAPPPPPKPSHLLTTLPHPPFSSFLTLQSFLFPLCPLLSLHTFH